MKFIILRFWNLDEIHYFEILTSYWNSLLSNFQTWVDSLSFGYVITLKGIFWAQSAFLRRQKRVVSVSRAVDNACYLKRRRYSSILIELVEPCDKLWDFHKNAEHNTKESLPQYDVKLQLRQRANEHCSFGKHALVLDTNCGMIVLQPHTTRDVDPGWMVRWPGFSERNLYLWTRASYVPRFDEAYSFVWGPEPRSQKCNITEAYLPNKRGFLA